MGLAQEGRWDWGALVAAKVVLVPSLLEWHREEKPAQEEECVLELPAEICSILIPAGSRGVNTLCCSQTPALLVAPGSMKREVTEGWGHIPDMLFAASSPLTRCYLTKDGASCRGGEERDKLVITGESLAWQSHSLAGMCVKSPVSTSKPAPQGELDPHTALPGSPKTSSEAGERLGKPQSASWAGKKTPEGRKVVRDVQGML